LKPDIKPESFCGLLNFSVSRETYPVPGSSGDLPIHRRRLIPAHFLCRNHFYSFLPARPAPQENQEVRAAGQSPHSFFDGTTFAHSSGPRPVLAMKSGDRDRRESPHFVIEGTTFPHSFPARPAPRKTKMSGPPDSRRTLLRGNHFYSFLSQRDQRPGSHEIGRAGGAALSREPLCLIPSDRDWPAQEARKSEAVGSPLCSEGTAFPRSLCFTDALART
jgi:hypothetical protein